MQCDLCGKEGKFIALIEGAELSVCKYCSKFGKTINEIKKYEKERTKKIIEEKKENETIELIISGYGVIIKKKREQLRLTQKELAQKISEKESVLHNIESERFEPSIELTKKFEMFLGVTLIEGYKEKGTNNEGKITKSKGLTLGDVIKKKD